MRLSAPIKKFFIFGFVLVSGVFFFGVANAKSVFDIAYPVSELGNCADRRECKTYCDDETNTDACYAFAKEYGVEITVSKDKMVKIPDIGPGGCKGIKECRSYCDDVNHTKECFDFGKAHNLIDSKEEKNLEKVLEGGGPGGCTSEDTCRTYCNDAAHLDECVKFGEQKGLLSPEEAALMKKEGFESTLGQKQQKGFQGPGGCKSDKECKDYCDDSANQETCISYGVEHGFMTLKEAERARKFVSQIGPGGCKKEECKTYCDDSAHAEECFSFAEKNGLISKDEALKVRQVNQFAEQGGPGGCKGREACGAYCEDEAHQKECASFSKEHNLISREDESRFEESRKLEEVVRKQNGPGGCSSADECGKYCGDAGHVSECTAFSVAHDAISSEEAQKRLQDFSRQFNGPENANDDNSRLGRPQVTPFSQGVFQGKPSEEEMQKFRRFENRFRGEPVISPGDKNFNMPIRGMFNTLEKEDNNGGEREMNRAPCEEEGCMPGQDRNNFREGGPGHFGERDMVSPTENRQFNNPSGHGISVPPINSSGGFPVQTPSFPTDNMREPTSIPPPSFPAPNPVLPPAPVSAPLAPTSFNFIKGLESLVAGIAVSLSGR